MLLVFDHFSIVIWLDHVYILQVNRLGMDIQVDYFNITRKQINQLLGPAKAKEYLSKRSIFSITIGANDFLNNYLLPVLSIGERLSETPDQFVDHLINNLRIQLTVSLPASLEIL